MLVVVFPIHAIGAKTIPDKEAARPLNVEFKQGIFSIHAEEIPLGEVLAEIEKRSGFTISIEESLKRSHVTVGLSNMDIVKALQSITNAAGLGGYGISYRSTGTQGKIGQWVVDRVVLVDKGNSPEMPDKVGSALTQKDKNQGKITKKPKTIEKEPYFDKRLNRYVEVVKGEVLVRFRFPDGRDIGVPPPLTGGGEGEGEQKRPSEAIDKFNKEKGTKIIKSYEKIGAYRLKIPTTETVQEFIERHLIDEKQVYIEPVFLTHQQAVLINDPSFKYQWSIPVIQADKAWEINSGSPDTIVAVVDTGIDITHPDLKNRIISGVDIIDENSSGVDDNGHGTYVAGIIAAEANNSIGIAGVSYKSKLMPVKVLTASGEGSYADLIEGIIYAVDHGTRILNLSLGGYSYSQFLGDAIQYAHSSRAVIMAAGGNENTDEQLYPAAYPNVIAVSATDPSDQRWTSSNYGSYIRLSAPGVGVLSTLKNNGYGEATGTSVSTAHVSGVVALILSKSKNPDFSNTQVENILYQTADDLWDKGWDSYYGFGRVNALKAIEKAGIEIHDVAVSGIKIEPETFKVGEATKIIVMVENQGTFVEKNLLVNVSINDEAVAKEQIVEKFNPNEKIDVGFNWIPKTNEGVVIVAEVVVSKDDDPSDNKNTRKIYLAEIDGKLTIKYAISSHRWLTYQGVEFLRYRMPEIFNEINLKYNENSKTRSYLDDLKDGAEHEDCSLQSLWGICDLNNMDVNARWYRHFFRPTDDRGYTDPIWGTFDNSFVWGYDHSDNSYDWVETVKKYKNKTKKEAYFSLGHVLHLIEDASLPEHTHLEAHADDQYLNGFILEQYGYENFVKRHTNSDTSATLALELSIPPASESIEIYDKFESYIKELAKLSYYRNRFPGILPSNPVNGTKVTKNNGKLAEMFPSLEYKSGLLTDNGWRITEERYDTNEEVIWDPPYSTTDDWWETCKFTEIDLWGTYYNRDDCGFYYIEKSDYVIPKIDKKDYYPNVKDGTNDKYEVNTYNMTLAQRMAGNLIPLAIRYVSGAIMLFWNETHLGIDDPNDSDVLTGDAVNTADAIKQKFKDSYYKKYGSAAKIGYPINFLHKWVGYWVQDFRPMKDGNGNEIGSFGNSIMIYNPGKYDVFVVHGDIWKHPAECTYECMGGPQSWLGPPVSNEYTHPTYGAIQEFKYGYITHKNDGGAWWEAYPNAPPTVSIIEPSNDSSVSGTVKVSTSAVDDIGVKTIEFYKDNVLVQRFSSSPSTNLTSWNTIYSWNTIDTSNGKHYLYVKACDAANNCGISSTITVNVNNSFGNNPPNTPTALYQYKSDGLTGMAAGATTNERTIVMKGNVTDPDNDAVSLEVEIKPVGTNFSNTPSSNCVSGGFVSSGGTAIVTCSALADGQYHWQARAEDSKGSYSGWSSAGGNLESAADFIVSAGSTAINEPPKVTVISPNGGETLTAGSSYTIKWIASDDKQVQLVSIYYSTDSGANWVPIPGAVFFDNPGSYQWVVPPVYSTTAKIRAIAYDGQLTGVDASDGNFTIAAGCTVPSVPELYSIGILNESGSYTVSWSNVYGAESYTLQEATNSSFTNPIEYPSLTQPSRSISGKTTNTYYYRVRANNSCGSSGSSGWSNIVSIPVVINQPPNAPSNPSPVDGAINVSRQPTLLWTAGDPDGSVDYAIFFGTNPNDPGIIRGFNSGSTAPSYVFTYDLNPGTTYYWYIRARDDKGVTTTGPLWRFTTEYSYADLVPANLTISGNIAPNAQVTLNLTVKNQGTYTAPGAQVFFYLSSTTGGREQKLNNNGTIIPQLTPGQETTISQTVTLSNLKAGQSYIDVWIDTQYYFTEGNINNNILSYAINYQDANAPVITAMWFAWGLTKVRTGYEYPIVWNVTDDIGVTKLGFYYSIDNGTNWKTIETGFVPGSNGYSNSYLWTIPSDAPLTDQLKIKMVAWDTSGNSTEATTGQYTIVSGVPPTVTLLSPNGGETWDLGSSQTIRWSVDAPNGIGNITLLLYYNNKVEIIAYITNSSTGSYTWTISNASYFVTNSAKIKISIEDMNWNVNEDWSDNYFAITDNSAPPPAPWTVPQVLTSVPSTNWPYTSKANGSPILATDNSGNVHMAYVYEQDDSSGLMNNTIPARVITQQVYYKKLSNGTWSTPESVYSRTQYTDGSLTGYIAIRGIQMAVDGYGYSHIVWTDEYNYPITNQNQNDIYYVYFNGTSWSTPANLSNDIAGTEPLTSLVWSTKKDIPVAKSFAASAVYNGELYVFGGNQFLTNYKYNPSTDNWTQIADSPHYGVSEGGAAVVGNKIYVVGDAILYKELKIYDPVNNSWSMGPEMPTSRRLPVVAAVNGKLYVIGGGDRSLNPLNTVEEYDPATNEWNTKRNMPTPRYSAMVAVVNSQIYVLGGRGSSGMVDNVEAYDPLTDTWTVLNSMPRGRSQALAAVVNNKIYLVGGSGSYGYSNAVEEYDPSTETWLSKTSMPTARMAVSGGAIGSNIYVVGGYDGTNNLSVNEQVTLSEGGSGTVSGSPKLSVDSSNNVYVVWRDGYSFSGSFPNIILIGETNIYYRERDSAGNWSSTSQITTGSASDHAIILGADNNRHLAYRSPLGVSYIKWDGIAWSSPITIIADYPDLIDMAVDQNNNPHIVWYTYDSSLQEQQIRYSYYDGTGFSNPEKISNASDGRPFRPSIVFDSSGRAHVIYEETKNGPRILYKYKDSTGWSAPVQLNLSSQSVGQYSSDIAISPDDQIYVVWTSYYNGYQEVFYNYADVSGFDISAPMVSVTSPSIGGVLSIGSTTNITWTATDNGGVSNISIEYSTDGGNSYTLLSNNEVNDGIYEWIVPNITSNNALIKITATDGVGNQGVGFSGIFSISDETTPSVILTYPNGGEIFEAGSTQNITWTATDIVGVSSVDLSYSTDGGNSWVSILEGTTNIGTYTWTVPYNLSANCIVKIVVYDAEGQLASDVSNKAFTILLPNTPPLTPNSPNPLDTETNVSIQPILGWQGGDLDGADSITYTVYFGTSNEPPVVSANQIATLYNPGRLTPLTTYYWKILASDGKANTPGPVWSLTTGPEPINVPTNLIATAISSNEINLSWVDNSDNETGFSVERKGSPDGSYVQIAMLPADTTSYTDRGLNGNSTYIYSIRALNAYTASSYSTEAVATTANNAPSTPSSPAPADGSSDQSITSFLSWTGGDPDAGDVVTYDVYFGSSSNPPLISTGQTETWFDPGTLEYGKVHFWRVEAIDSNGNTTVGPLWYFVTSFDLPKSLDTTAPDTSITAKPSNPANSPSVSFSFTSTEVDSTFECEIDNRGYSTCTSPKSYTLVNGVHTFCVKAIDSAGNTDPTPECYSWTIDTTDTETTSPAITATPTTLPFGNVNIDSSSERTVSVRNDGNANLVIGTITDPSLPFRKVSDNCSGQTLSSSAGCTITIKFSPKSTETFTSSVNIPSNDPDENPVTISLTGAGTNAGSPDITVLPSLDLSFPNISVGITADQTITVKNEGTSDLIISIITSPPAPFGIVTGADNCSNHTLTPDQSCTTKVRFTPAASGTFSSSLIIPSNDPDEDPVTINLNASATPGANNPPAKPNLAEPANGASGMPTILTLKWEISTDADGDSVTYRLYIGTDPGFAEVSPKILASASDGNNSAMAMRYSIGIIGLVGIIAIGRLSSNRKKMGFFFIVIIMVTGFIFTSCGSGGGGDGKNNGSDNKSYESYTINLQPDTTYYWKVVADDGKGGVTESDTYSFTTGR